MWVLEKIRSSMESVPLELNHYMGWTSGETFRRDKLHDNIITPERIPEFSLPPRLHKRSREEDIWTTDLSSQEMMENKENIPKKPLPFSAEAYGLAGIRESPNTRRKESLFHIRCTKYILDEDTPSRRDVTTRHQRSFYHLLLPSGKSEKFASNTSVTHLKEETSCPSLIEGKVGRQNGSPVPPLVLQCQERWQKEHVLPLHGRGQVCLSAERLVSESCCTVRIRLVSLEDLRDEGSPRPLDCSVSVCLTPGKLQRQWSAVVRNCRRPVFNEDFFFTGLSREDLLELELRVKVMDKPPAGALRRATVIGVVSKPLCHLLTLRKE